MNVVLLWIASILIITMGPVLTIYLIWKIIGFRGYMSLFQFIEGKSFLYRVDPRVKILMAIVITTVAAFTIWWISAIFLAVMLVLYVFTVNPTSKYRIVLPLTLATFLGTAWTEALFTNPSLLTELFGLDEFILPFPPQFQIIGAYGLSEQGFFYGLQIAFRASAAVASGFLLVFTSSPADILRSLEKSKVPVELGFALVVAVIAIPKILESAMTILDAMRVRGFDFGPAQSRNVKAVFSKFFQQIRAVLMATASIIIWTLKGAENIAISADLRGFRANKVRTYYHEVAFHRIDWIAMVILIAVFAVGVYLSGIGYGPLAYNP